MKINPSSSSALFSLLRLALGTGDCEADLRGLSDGGWRELVVLASAQGVAAIAFDGLQKLYDAEPGLKLGIDRESVSGFRYKWLSSVFKAERDYAANVCAAEALAKKTPLVVLKGISVARKYPVPSHRQSVDLDVYGFRDFVPDDECRIVRDDYKHTAFRFREVMVEYHKSLTVWRSLKGGREIEQTLREELGAPEGMFAGEEFNALFLAVHSYVHFMLEGGITLRHLCDWMLVFDDLKKENPKEGERVLEILGRFGMREFTESMTRVTGYVCTGEPLQLGGTDRRMLDDILSLGDRKHFADGHLDAAFDILFRSGWKFKAFARESNVACLVRCVLGWLRLRIFSRSSREIGTSA